VTVVLLCFAEHLGSHSDNRHFSSREDGTSVVIESKPEVRRVETR